MSQILEGQPAPLYSFAFTVDYQHLSVVSISDSHTTLSVPSQHPCGTLRCMLHTVEADSKHVGC